MHNPNMKITSSLDRVRSYRSPLPPELLEQVRWRILGEINEPWFESGGDRAANAAAVRCYREVQQLVNDRPEDGRRFLSALIVIATRWEAAAGHPSSTMLTGPLLQYNAALVHSRVLEVLED